MKINPIRNYLTQFNFTLKISVKLKSKNHLANLKMSDFSDN